MALENITDIAGNVDNENYELTITKDQITSTEPGYTDDVLNHGKDYQPVDAYFVGADGKEIKRSYSKGEKRKSNQTLPRLVCQIFENEIENLSSERKADFPTGKNETTGDDMKGIFDSVDAFQNGRNRWDYMKYDLENGKKFVIYSWEIFSTVTFVQRCLTEFGKPGDQFVLVYKKKPEGQQTAGQTKQDISYIETVQENTCNFKNPYSQVLIDSKNVIFRGAPGTGKSYLAKQIAADIVSDGACEDYADLDAEQRLQVEFVQFHPSYDYTDFVEGLRPRLNDAGTMGFELQDGIFKRFADRARKNYENSHKTDEAIEKELSAQEAMEKFFEDISFGEDKFKTINGNEFTITNVDDKHIFISIPGNATVNQLTLSLDEIRQMLESEQKFEKIKDITAFFDKKYAAQAYSYDFVLYKAIDAKKKKAGKPVVKREAEKKYVFIIDEINRGEISKIFGELFYSVDPGYRGRAGEISTQYANLHQNPNEKFYIPENLYIIGTMNDIDRSVDSFDFAMRRRFRFIELKADEHIEMLNKIDNQNVIDEAVNRMIRLNQEISNVSDLNDNYHIGASYFLKLPSLDNDFDKLWTDYLEPLLQEYVSGIYGEKEIMKKFADAYGFKAPAAGGVNDTAQDQG